jgi:hypothetical protein
MKEEKPAESPPDASLDAPLFRGVLGGGCAHPGRANLRLIRRAIREGWDISEAKRRALVEHLVGVCEAGNDRNTIAAVRCLIEADCANVRAEALSLRGL